MVQEENMKRKHLTFEDRKLIASGISHGLKCNQIAQNIGCDSTSISKEIKRNRIISKPSKLDKNSMCSKLDRFPFVCGCCDQKYKNCPFTQYTYNAQIADGYAEKRLSDTRKGINLTKEEHEELVQLIKNGLEEKKSLFTIINELTFKISLPTVYRYIDKGEIEVKKIDLPYAVTYKKRKSNLKKYDYSNTKINRENRTYLDYIAFKKANNSFTVQMDFLGSVRSDTKSILTLSIVDIHFCLIFLVENKNAEKVVNIFNEIENKIGIEKFRDIFGSILTDRDPCFADFENIENNFNGEFRTRVFYCDAYVSNQKGNVENLNKQLRKFFPKKQSLLNVDEEKVKTINKAINEANLKSLDGFTPKEAFIKIFGEDTFNKLC